MLLGCVVNQNVDLAEFADSLIDCFLAELLLANIAVD
jgi:hypothetical protein